MSTEPLLGTIVGADAAHGTIVGNSLDPFTDPQLIGAALEYYAKYCHGRAQRMVTRNEHLDVLNRDDMIAWWKRTGDRSQKLFEDLVEDMGQRREHWSSP
jgi:hypothetical protein